MKYGMIEWMTMFYNIYTWCVERVWVWNHRVSFLSGNHQSRKSEAAILKTPVLWHKNCTDFGNPFVRFANFAVQCFNNLLVFNVYRRRNEAEHSKVGSPTHFRRQSLTFLISVLFRSPCCCINFATRCLQTFRRQSHDALRPMPGRHFSPR